jgi:hypothetical protein
MSFPTAGVSDDGVVYFGWNPGRMSLDVEVDAAGIVSWFFADHETRLTITSEGGNESGYLTFVKLFRRTQRT